MEKIIDLYPDLVLEYIESNPLLFWQKYVEGVNMTQFPHSFNQTTEQIPKNNNTFYLKTSSREVLIIQFSLFSFQLI